MYRVPTEGHIDEHLLPISLVLEHLESSLFQMHTILALDSTGGPISRNFAESRVRAHGIKHEFLQILIRNA